MEMKIRFDSNEYESKWYNFWLKNHYFAPSKKLNKNFCIILPPPNVTGHLHLGHAWDGSIQDAIIRYKKLNGFNANWLPGTDHAGIATQTKFEKELQSKNIKRSNLTRKQFIDLLSEWKNNQINFIHEQWAKMGFALNYDDETFTMDERVNSFVNDVFIKMYNDGLIYRDYKLVNWDVKLQSAISDIEVINKQTKSKMYYFKYWLEDHSLFLEVATTRPETMFGDICLVVNPNDRRYQKYINKKVINPINKKLIPIITDEYVDLNFGTGVMKCTPAHDFNDYAIAKRHNITNYSNVMNYDGTLNKNAVDFNDKSYENIERFKAREIIVDLLEKSHNLIKIENHDNNIGYSERTNVIVEPLLSKQWFVKMKPLAKLIIDSFKSSNKTVFSPKRFENTLSQWMNNIEDWCISRQLWWGHQLPVYYRNEDIYVGLNPPDGFVRDDDVLDTWFSSALWPLITTKYSVDNEYFAKYFPIDVLVTAYDILFFWVSRMMIDSFYLTKKSPFKNVLIHGLIRDSQGKKMSKSLGNGVDPMLIINKYGADSLRLFLTSSSSMGEDLRFSEEKVKQYWVFINKLWNSGRYIFSNVDKKFEIDNNKLLNVDKWILNRFKWTIDKVKKHMDIFDFNIANKTLIDFIWNDFCNNYIELTKNKLTENTKAILLFIYKNILIMLHPHCPFITEEIYHFLPNKEKKSIMLENWPEYNNNFNENTTDTLIEIIQLIRNFRNVNQIKNTTQLEINLISSNKDINTFDLSIVNTKILNNKQSNNKKIIIGSNFKIEILNSNIINQVDEIKNLETKMVLLTNEVKRSNSILSNKEFISKAPKEKINLEIEKLKKYETQLEEVKRLLSKK